MPSAHQVLQLAATQGPANNGAHGHSASVWLVIAIFVVVIVVGFFILKSRRGQ